MLPQDELETRSEFRVYLVWASAVPTTFHTKTRVQRLEKPPAGLRGVAKHVNVAKDRRTLR